MKRVAIDINSVVPYYVRGWVSGIGRTTMELVKAMDQLDDLPFEVVLYSQNMKGIGGRNMNLHFSNKHLYFPFRKQYNKILSHTPIRELLTGYDLLHIPHNHDYLHNPDRSVITIHDTLYFTYPEQRLDHEFARQNYPQLAKKCRGIITCSESSKRDIIKYLGVKEEKVDVCYWGYNNNLFRNDRNRDVDKPYFLMVSCSLGRKNTMNLLRAYSQFAKHQPQHHLKLVWPNAPKEVVDYLQAESLSKYVEICTQVSDVQLASLYKGATATFYPSRYEGFGLPVLESMACGTPVVTCSNSSLPEVGGNAAFYVDPDDIDAMAKYMEQFENGGIDKDDVIGKCLAQANKFSWEQCARQTIEVYKKYLD